MDRKTARSNRAEVHKKIAEVALKLEEADLDKRSSFIIYQKLDELDMWLKRAKYKKTESEFP